MTDTRKGNVASGKGSEGLSFCPMPIEIGLPPVTMNWAVWTDKDIGLVWLRDQIRSVIDAIAPDRVTLAAE